MASYTIDANGNPVLASRHLFITGLTGAEGAAIDPLTGDFLFSTFGGANQLIEVRGFTAPAPPPSAAIPTLSQWGIALAAMLLMISGLLLVRRMRRPWRQK